MWLYTKETKIRSRGAPNVVVLKMRLKSAQMCPKMPKQGQRVPKGVQNKIKGCPKVPKIRSSVAQNDVPKCAPKKGKGCPKCGCTQR